jgi:hypothetical protein
VDLLPSEGKRGARHFQMDVRKLLHGSGFGASLWDLLICHPECTRLTNAGGRWLHNPPNGKTLQQIWRDFHEACEFYWWLRSLNVKHKAIENPVMNSHARAALGFGKGGVRRHVVQPWWFGDPAFKATGWELHGLPPLVATKKLTPPKAGTEDHITWSWVHRCPPSPDRWKIRSKSFPGMAEAMADQWGSV